MRNLATIPSSVTRDARQALRVIRRRPLFSIVVVTTLALGIGANAAIFSLVYAVLLHPVPTPRLDRLVVVREALPALRLFDADISVGEALDLRSSTGLFQNSTAYRITDLNVTGAGAPKRLTVATTVGDYFGTLEVHPTIGTVYGPDGSRVGAAPVVVLSHEAWEQIGGGDPNFVGRSLDLDGVEYRVVGVLPSDFRYPRGVEAFVPYRVTPQTLSLDARHALFMTFVARLQSGESADRMSPQLANEVARWYHRLGDNSYKGSSITLHAVPFVEYVAGPLRAILFVLMGAVAIVLLISCANVSSLQVVRAIARAKDIAVRSAIGASRAAIIRQVLTENVILSLLGGLFGVWVASLILTGLHQFRAADQAVVEAIAGASVSPIVLIFTILLSVAAGVSLGSIPAFRASRIDVQDTLRSSGRGGSMNRRQLQTLRVSVVIQIASSLMLFLAAVLAVRSLSSLLRTNPGFRASNAMTVRLSLPASAYSTRESRLAFYQRAIERIKAAPGIAAVGISSAVPFGSGEDSSPFEAIGSLGQPTGQTGQADIQIVDGEYLRAMGLRLLRGRALSEADKDTGDVVVLIDQRLATRYFGATDPIGQRIRQFATATVVGVVESARYHDLSKLPTPTVYYRAPQLQYVGSAVYITVRSSLPSAEVTRELGAAVREIDPNIPLFDAAPMTERLEQSLGVRRLAMLALGGFAVLALLIAGLGVYGVLSYAASQRRHEIGIRMALGADPANIRGLMLRNGLVLAATGVGIGLGIFVASARLLDSFVYGISPRDLKTLVIGTSFVLVIAAVASWLPARRASDVDPTVAFRGE